MAETSLQKRLRGLILSAADLHALRPEWPGALIEDYLNIFDNLVDLAVSVDTSANLNIQTVTADYTTKTDDGLILADASSNPVTVTLDGSATEGQEHTVKCINDTFTCKAGRNGNNIDATAEDFELFKDESIRVKADSDNNWWIA